MKFESFNQNFGRMGGFTTPNNFIYFNSTTLPNIIVGATATLKLKMYSVEDMEPIYFAVWIDFNRNNRFETSEIIMQNSNTIMRALPTFTDGDLWITKTFPIPAGTPTGITRMRIARGMEPTGTTYRSTFILDPCPDAAAFLMGCAYDFNVNIVAGGGTTTTTRPIAGFSASATAGTVSTIFTLTDTSRNTPTSWAWSITPNTYTFVGGTSATSRNPQIQFTAAGAYAVKLVASNAAGADSVSRPAYINVTAAATTLRPVAGFTASATAGTVSTIFTLTDTSRNTPTDWTWTITPNTYTFVGGTSATSRNPQIQFTAAGAYTVKLVASNAAGADSIARPAYITVTPITTSMAGFKVDRTLGTTLTVFAFTDTSRPAATSWKWSFTPNTITYQAGTTATSQNPKIKCNAPGFYTVKLVVNNSTRSDSVTKTNFLNVATTGIEEMNTADFQVFPNPTNGILHCPNACIGAQVTLIDLSGKIVMQLNNLESTEISLQRMAAGTYTLIMIKYNLKHSQVIEVKY